MNIDLIKNDTFREIVSNIVEPCSWKKVVELKSFPFDEWQYFENDMPNEPSLNNFNLIKQMIALYEIDQYVYGVLTIEGIDYIVSVDNEFTIRVVGDTESNWLRTMFYLHDNLDKFELFMQECNRKLGILIKEPDFEHFSHIDNDILEPLIFGNWQP